MYIDKFTALSGTAQLVTTRIRIIPLFAPERFRLYSHLRQVDTFYHHIHLNPSVIASWALPSPSETLHPPGRPEEVHPCRAPHITPTPTPRPDRGFSTMAEPSAKRIRRGDSAGMWDSNESRPASDREAVRNRRRSPVPRDDRRDTRHRSRSREHHDRKRERSWSRDRRDRRDEDRNRKRSTSRDHNYERRGRSPVLAMWSQSIANISFLGMAPKNVKFRDRERSRSPGRNGTRARSPPRGPKSDRRDNRSRDDGRKANGTQPATHYDDKMDLDYHSDADEDEMEAQMRKAMGFTRFRTTKNTKVPGNDIYGVRKEKKIEYRQYMNRQGGFNRPLSPSR